MRLGQPDADSAPQPAGREGIRRHLSAQALRGETDPGVEKGLDMALRELNDLLPRRRRVK